ncbi:MAG: Alkane 1-monooxygenase [Pseudomonadota bacterium]
MSTPALAHEQPWKDKRWWWLLSPAIPLVFTGSMLAAVGTGVWWCMLLAPLIIHVWLPLLDRVFGEDFSNPPESAVAQLDGDVFYRVLVWAYVPVQVMGTVLGAWMAVSQPLPWMGYVALVFTVGAINGVGIGTAHELGHKKESLDRWLSKIALAPSVYGHFFVEHNRGHHKRVATPEDPASARLGESFWAFLPRSVAGSWQSAWALEQERLNKQGMNVWHPQNHNLQAWGMTLLLFGALVAWLGWVVLPFLLLQAVYAASMLEVVNYVEHYGLMRQKDASGRYVRCEPEHSWNSNHLVGNLLLYQLQRHSDHHAHPSRRYQALRHFESAPQLPAGYATMITVAYWPRLWFAWMDPRVMAHYGGNMDLTNSQALAAQRLSTPNKAH